jgi:hypothetical protein
MSSNRNNIPNGLEFVLGGEPALPGATPRPDLLVDGNDAIFVFTRTDVSASLNPVVEFSTTLSGTWATAVHGLNAAIQTSNGAPADTVTVRIPRSGRE